MFRDLAGQISDQDIMKAMYKSLVICFNLIVCNILLSPRKTRKHVILRKRVRTRIRKKYIIMVN